MALLNNDAAKQAKARTLVEVRLQRCIRLRLDGRCSCHQDKKVARGIKQELHTYDGTDVPHCPVVVGDDAFLATQLV